MRKEYASQEQERQRAEAEQQKKKEQAREWNLRQLRSGRAEGDHSKVREATDALLAELDEQRQEFAENNLGVDN